MDKNSSHAQPALQNFDTSSESPASFIFKLKQVENDKRTADQKSGGGHE